MLKLFFHGLPFPENCQSNYWALVFLFTLGLRELLFCVTRHETLHLLVESQQYLLEAAFWFSDSSRKGSGECELK